MPFYGVMVEVWRRHYVRVSASSAAAAQQAADQQVAGGGADMVIDEVRTPKVCGRQVVECCGEQFTTPMAVVIHFADSHDMGVLRDAEGQQ